MPQITIYTTPDCRYCIAAKEFFAEHNIEYTEKNVAEDKEAGKEMIELSGQMGVPVIKIDDKVVVGYSEAYLKGALL